MMRKEDIEHAVSLGVDAIGLIFFQKSARCISIEQAKKLIKDIPAFVDVVAVLVNPEKSFVTNLIQELPIQFLQFHGDESNTFCEQFNKPYIKAIMARSAEKILDAIKDHPQAVAILLDTPSSMRGGTGTAFDWTTIPSNLSKPFILAGGLTPENVNSAVMACSPYAVDVASGVEYSPGIKNHEKMTSFVKVIGEKK